MIEQKDEKQCQGCLELTKHEGNACFPRVFSYLLINVNETAEASHKATFGNCPYRELAPEVKEQS